MERKNLDLKIFENIRQIDNLKYMGEIGNTRRNWRYLQHRKIYFMCFFIALLIIALLFYLYMVSEL